MAKNESTEKGATLPEKEGHCLMNTGDTPDLGGGVISALSFRHSDLDILGFKAVIF